MVAEVVVVAALAIARAGDLEQMCAAVVVGGITGRRSRFSC